MPASAIAVCDEVQKPDQSHHVGDPLRHLDGDLVVQPWWRAKTRCAVARPVEAEHERSDGAQFFPIAIGARLIGSWRHAPGSSSGTQSTPISWLNVSRREGTWRSAVVRGLRNGGMDRCARFARQRRCSPSAAIEFAAIERCVVEAAADRVRSGCRMSRQGRCEGGKQRDAAPGGRSWHARDPLRASRGGRPAYCRIVRSTAPSCRPRATSLLGARRDRPGRRPVRTYSSS